MARVARLYVVENVGLAVDKLLVVRALRVAICDERDWNTRQLSTRQLKRCAHMSSG